MPRPPRSPFDDVADTYERVRPGYPDDAVDDLLALAATPPGGKVLEIGAGTGQLTVSLAERGLAVTAVEAGVQLAARLRRNLADYRRTQVIVDRFEDAQLPAGAYDLVAAATSFHWLDEQIAYAKAAEILRGGGALGLLWNVHVDRDEGFFKASQEVYARHAPELLEPGLSASLDGVQQQLERARAIEGSGYFADVDTRTYPWTVEYDRKHYLALLGTYSRHLALAPLVAAALDADLATLIDRDFGGRVVKHHETVLFVAHVRHSAAP